MSQPLEPFGGIRRDLEQCIGDCFDRRLTTVYVTREAWALGRTFLAHLCPALKLRFAERCGVERPTYYYYFAQKRGGAVYLLVDWYVTGLWTRPRRITATNHQLIRHVTLLTKEEFGELRPTKQNAGTRFER